MHIKRPPKGTPLEHYLEVMRNPGDGTRGKRDNDIK